MTVFFYMSFVPVAVGLALAGLVIYWDHQRAKALIGDGLYQPLTQTQRFLVPN